MKKRIFWTVFLIVIIGAGATLAYIFRDNIANFFHRHHYEVTEEVAATCTDDGHKKYVCTGCGEETTETLPALGHTEEVVPGYAADCDDDGLTNGSKCCTCGEVFTAQEVIPALGHDLTQYRKESTCTVFGDYYDYCLNCDYRGSSYTPPLKAHAYELTEEVVATCTDDGHKKYTCTGCGGETTETIPALGHIVVDGECDRCAYQDLAVIYPNGYSLVAVGANENMTGRLLQVGKVEEDYSCAYLVSIGGTLLPGSIVNGVSYSATLGEIFEYNGYYYVQADNVVVAILQEGAVYFVEPIVIDNLANWTLPASEGYTVDGNAITFAGTNELVFATTEKYSSVSLTFKVSETQDVRGAFQIGWGAQSTDASINTLPFVQFNYDRAVLVLPDGTTYDTSWLTGKTWKLTINAENNTVVLSVDGQVVYNVDSSWWTPEGWGLPGYLVLRAESNCALTFELTEMNPTA